MKEQLEVWLRQFAEKYAVQSGIDPLLVQDCEVVTSKEISQGDFATNLAFKFSKPLRKSPKVIAEEICRKLDLARPDFVKKVEVGGGGFLNFFLSRQSLNEILFFVRKEDCHYGKSDYGKKKKVLVEFVSANPTGPLTIAHGRQAAIGDTLVRLLKSAGFQAASEYYLNDAGRQMNLLGKSVWARFLTLCGENRPLPEDGYQGEYVAEIAKRMLQEKSLDFKNTPEESAVGDCRIYAEKMIMAGILDDLKSVDVHFDNIFRESSLYQEKKVEEAFRDLEKRGYLFEKEGALWFRSTDFGDDKDRVVRKSSGELTYISPDIAYHRGKFERGYEKIVDLLGPDHHGYVTRLKASCAALGHDPNQVSVRIVQLTTLFRKGVPVRMSTRAGEFVTLRELVTEVGKDAARIFFLTRKIESPLDFDLELAKEKSQDNPVYYLQYAHARIASILRNAPIPISEGAPVELLKSDEEIEVIKKIYDYKSTIISAAEALEPYRLVDYLRELAACFHKFYAQHRVLSEDLPLTQARLCLVDAVRIVLRNGLELLGASQPESM